MIIKENKQDSFIIVWLGDENKPHINFTNEFTNSNDLKKYIIDKEDSTVIVILSNDIQLDTLSPADLPQICAVYNEKLISLYCLPHMVSSVDKYIKKSSLFYILSAIGKQWFLIGVGISIFLAYLCPNIAKTGGYIRAEYTIKWGSIMLIFFLSGLSVKTKQLIKKLLKIRLHLLVQTYSFLIIPFISYGFGLLLIKFSFNNALVMGIIILGSTSTTISSNVIMTKNALGDECAALLNAVLGNSLGIFISPPLIFYFMKNSNFHSLVNTHNINTQLDYTNVVKTLSLTVLIPLIIGQIIQYIWTKQVTYIREKFHFDKLNSLILLTLPWTIFSTAFANGTFKIVTKIELFILILITSGMFLIFSLFILIICRLPIPYWQFSKQESVAIIYCGASKSLAMCISLLNALYGDDNLEIIGLFSLPSIMYQYEQLIFGAIQGIFIKKWVKKDISVEDINMDNRSNNEEDLKKEESEILNVDNKHSISNVD